MSDYTEILNKIPGKDLEKLAGFLRSKPYLEMFCKTIIHNGSHTIHLESAGTIWQIRLKSLTDIDTLIEQLGEDPIVTVPCVQCGYCCRRSACMFGWWDEKKSQCGHLTEDNLCAIYKEILNSPGSDFSPAFGAGCCSSLFNADRERILRKRSSRAGSQSSTNYTPKAGL